MSNPIKIIADLVNPVKFYIGTWLLLTELKLFVLDNIIVDSENYYSLLINYGEIQIVNVDFDSNIIFGERDKILDYTTNLLAIVEENENPYVSFTNDYLNFSIIKTGLPTGLENSFFILNQWEKAPLGN